MKKLIGIFLLSYCVTSFGVGVTDGDEATSFSNPASPSRIILATQTAQIANEANQADQRINNAALINSTNEVKGVMVCTAHYKSYDDGDYVYDGCKTEDGHLSLNDYFNRYKPDGAKEISMVIFNDHQYIFDIYYK